MRKIAIILAGGSGTRFKSNIPKQFVLLKNKPIITYSIEKFIEHDKNVEIVVVSSREFVAKTKELLKKYFPGEKIHIAEGGNSRTQSVRNGLKYIEQNLFPANDTLVAIHDSARPLIPSGVISEAFDLAQEKGNAVCCVPLKFAIRKKINGRTKSVDRSLFYEVQTPQIFRWDILRQSYRQFSDKDFYDSASLVEEVGYEIFISPGDYKNIKITTPEDLLVAEVFLSK